MRFESGLNRRALAAGLFGAPMLGGCAEFLDQVFDSCPAERSEVDWIVDIAHPVFCGVEDAVGSPRPMRLFYPSAGPQRGALLQPCLQKWPIVLFLHGMPPIQGQPTSPWSSVWTRLPETVARCGYVVAVPTHDAQLIERDVDATVAAAMADIEWVRTGWSGAPWVDQRLSATTVGGHSYGALIAARTAATHPVGALVSLSGPYVQVGAIKQALKQVTAPSFFMWGGGLNGSQFDDLDQVMFWANELTQDRYAAVYSQGGHFDYVDAAHTGGAERGPCDHVGAASADLAALFIASNIVSLTGVDPGLHKPQVTLTPQQQMFAEGHLQGLDGFAGPGCHMTLRWVVDGQTGAREFGTPP